VEGTYIRANPRQIHLINHSYPSTEPRVILAQRDISIDEYNASLRQVTPRQKGRRVPVSCGSDYLQFLHIIYFVTTRQKR